MIPTDEEITRCFQDGITQSEIMVRGNCIRKWMFRYVLRLRKRGSFSWSLSVGGAIHRMLEEYYRLTAVNGPTPETPIQFPENGFNLPDDVILHGQDAEQQEYWTRVCELLVRQHNHYYKNTDQKLIILETEKELEYTYRGIPLKGVIDLGFEETFTKSSIHDFYIMDHKTTTDLSDNLLCGFQFRFQFLFYSWLWKQITGTRPAGFLVNALKKPLERRSVKNSESLTTFLHRIERNVISEPANYFRRIQIPLDDDTLLRFQRTILDPLITQMQWTQALPTSDVSNQTREALLISANTDHCHSWNRACEFLDLCANNLEDFAGEFVQDEVKHPEFARRN
jgi:PD-(D/E)XK nuclease superfamily